MKAKEEWLDDMELRLKRAYLDLADLSEEEGQRFLTQEIRSHLEDISGESNRREYLMSLRQRFPLLLSQENRLSEEDMRALQAGPAEVTPAEALNIVRRHWEEIDPTARLAFTEAFGLVREDERSASGDAIGDATDELVRFLKMPADAALSVERLQETVLALLKAVSQVDSLSTQVFKQMGLSREVGQADLRKATGNYLTGAEGGSAEINALIDETRRKVALIISSIAGLGTAFAQAHLARFQPAAIEQAAGSGGLLRGKDTACWKKYVTMAEDLHPDKVEKAINDHMVKNLKRLNRD